MKAGLPAAFANSAARRDPTTGEISGGFPCGPLDIELFNELVSRSTQAGIEISNVIEAAGIVPAAGDLTQLLQVLRSSITGTKNVAQWATPGVYSWTVPDGVTRIRCRVWGGGGGGAGATAGNAATGGHGGGYSEGFFAVSPGDVLPIVVGAGGSGGSAGNNGSTGGTSSVGTLLSATGGGGGRASGAATTAIGNGSGGQVNVKGMQAANSYSMLSPVVGSAGAGAFGTAATAISVSGGFAGGFPAGGGGGAANNNSGADGGDGWVIIEH